jgi:hypothetical protein
MILLGLKMSTIEGNMNTPPILLTSCVYISDDSVTLKSAQDRIHLTLESIKRWLEVAPKSKIVICDNSNYDFSELLRQYFPNENIECLSFSGDKKAVITNGKGYGEGEIIEYAIRKSRYILEADCFTKSTARLWVENYQYFLRKWNGKCILKPVFKNSFSLKTTEISYIDTRFYMISLDLYRKYFERAHQSINRESPDGIEEIFLKIVFSQNLKNIFSQKYPQIYGVSGASGQYYRNSVKKNIKENLRLFLHRNNASFKNLFLL